MTYNGSNLSYSTCQRYIYSGLVNIDKMCTKVFQVMQILKPVENNISWLPNWLKVSFLGSEPSNPKTDTHFVTNYLFLNKFFFVFKYLHFKKLKLT